MGRGCGITVRSTEKSRLGPQARLKRQNPRNRCNEDKFRSLLRWPGGWLFGREWIVEMDLDVFQKGRQWRAPWAWMPEAVKTWVGTWGMAGEMVFGGRAEGMKPLDLALENCIDYWLCRGFLLDSVLWAVEPKVPSLFYPIRVVGS